MHVQRRYPVDGRGSCTSSVQYSTPRLCPRELPHCEDWKLNRPIHTTPSGYTWLHQSIPEYTSVHLVTLITSASPEYTWTHLTSPDHMGCEVEQPSPAGLSKFVKRGWPKAEVQEYSSLNFWQIMKKIMPTLYLFSCRFLLRHRSTCLSDHPVFLIGTCQRSGPLIIQ